VPGEPGVFPAAISVISNETFSESEARMSKSWDRWLLLTRRRILYILAAWVACVVLHNLIYALLLKFWGIRRDEGFFFLLAIVVIPLYGLVALGYTALRKLT